MSEVESQCEGATAERKRSLGGRILGVLSLKFLWGRQKTGGGFDAFSSYVQELQADPTTTQAYYVDQAGVGVVLDRVNCRSELTVVNARCRPAELSADRVRSLGRDTFGNERFIVSLPTGKELEVVQRGTGAVLVSSVTSKNGQEAKKPLTIGPVINFGVFEGPSGREPNRSRNRDVDPGSPGPRPATGGRTESGRRVS